MSQLALVFPGDARHRDKMAAAGAQRFIEFTNRVTAKGDDTWREAVRRVRPGDTVYIWVLVHVPTRRGVDELPPVAQVQEFVREVEARGAVLIEVYSGRRSDRLAERRAMIGAATEALKSKGRTRMPGGFRKPGRHALEFTPEQWSAAEAVWCDIVKYPSRAFAAMHMPERFTIHRAGRKWGPRELAHKKWLRRMAGKR